MRLMRPFHCSLSSLALLCLGAAITFTAACNPAKSQPSPASAQPSGARRYALKGKVISVDTSAGIANIDNQPIPGFMDEMVMAYTFKPSSAINQIKAGDSITAEVVVEGDTYWLENVK